MTFDKKFGNHLPDFVSYAGCGFKRVSDGHTLSIYVFLFGLGWEGDSFLSMPELFDH